MDRDPQAPSPRDHERPGPGWPRRSWRSMEAGASPLNAVWSGLMFGAAFGVAAALSGSHRAIGTDAVAAAIAGAAFAALTALVIVVRTRTEATRR